MKNLLLAASVITAVGLAPPAHANIVWNGNFDLSPGALGWGTGSTQHNLSGSTILGQTAIGATNTFSANEYQIVDAAHYNDGAQYTQNSTTFGSNWPSMPTNENGSLTNWSPTATSETFKFSYQYEIASRGSATVQLLAYTAPGPVPYNVNTATYNQMPGGTNWTTLYSNTVSSTTATGWQTVDVPVTTIPGDPEYFAIILTKSGTGATSVWFDTVSLDVTPVKTPEPASLALLGISILGTGWVSRRRRRPL